MSTQKASKEPILEEAELEFKPLEECEEGLEDEESRETKEAKAQREAVHKGLAAPVHLAIIIWAPSLTVSRLPLCLRGARSVRRSLARSPPGLGVPGSCSAPVPEPGY